MKSPASASSTSLLERRLLPGSQQKREESGKPYLKFLVNTKTSALLSMSSIQEAAVLPSRLLTTMPNMPPFMLGLINRRGRVLWVIDLSQILGLEKISFVPQNYDALITETNNLSAVFAIHKIEGSVRVEDDFIKATPDYISSTLSPYMNGYVLQNDSMSLLLNLEAIAQSSSLQQISTP